MFPPWGSSSKGRMYPWSTSSKYFIINRPQASIQRELNVDIQKKMSYLIETKAVKYRGLREAVNEQKNNFKTRDK